MNILLVLLLIFLLIFQEKSVIPDRQRAMKILENYSPESFYLMIQYLNAPNNYQLNGYEINFNSPVNVDNYIDYSNELTMINSLPVVIHEVCHGYTNRNIYSYLKTKDISYTPKVNYDLLYLSPAESILVEKSDVFRTSQMHPSIADSLKSFRYQTYIYPASDIGAQLDGAYGLLDEWNAYYHDMRTSMDLYQVYKKIDIDEKFAVLEFLKVANSTHLAYIEFKYYILKYLLYARQSDPEVYYEILANYAFRQAFTAIDQRFGDLNLKFNALKTKIIDDFVSRKIMAAENDQYFFLGRSGVGNFKQEYQRLEIEIQQKEYQEIIKTIYVN